MEIGTVKTERKLSISTISKGRVSKEGFAAELILQCGQTDLVGKARDAIEHKGRVYGVYQEKQLVGIYIFEWVKDYFIDNRDNADGISELQKLFEDGKAAYRMVFQYLQDEVAQCQKEIEDKIVADLKEMVEWGTVSGIEWGENLIYRKSMDKKDKDGMKTAAGYGLGFLSGWVIGWLVMDSIAFGLCFGVCYANLFGGIILSSSSRKQEWEIYDFVNQKYIEDKEEV